MMEEIMKAFDDDGFMKDDAFDDKMFDQLRKHGLGGFHGFNSTGHNVKVEEHVEKDGTISVIITPQNKNLKVDIKTTENQIVITSEMMEEVENENKQGRTRSYSKSSSSQTVRIPQGYTAKNPTSKDGSVIISLVPKEKSQFKPDSKGRIPVQKKDGEKTI
jgi:HSP20 family molecular chaperone IbpA